MGLSKLKKRKRKSTGEGRRDHFDESSAFRDQTYQYQIKNALTLIYTCVQAWSNILLLFSLDKDGSPQSKSCRKRFK